MNTATLDRTPAVERARPVEYPVPRDLGAILIVEDDPTDALLTQVALRRLRIANPVRIVASGAEFMDYLMARGAFHNREQYPRPGLVIMDLRLPDANGADLVAWMRLHPIVAKIPVLVITMSEDPKRLQQVRDAGAVAVLQKPLNAPKFAQAVFNLRLDIETTGNIQV